MNRVTFNKLQSAIESLSHSTQLTMIASKASVTLTGRCSVYKSHQGIEYALGIEELPLDALIVANERYVVGICGFYADERKAVPYVPRAGRHGVQGRVRINDDPDAETEAQCLGRNLLVMAENLSEYELSLLFLTVPASLVDPFQLLATDFSITEQRATTPLLTVVFALPMLGGYEPDAEGIMRPVFVRKGTGGRSPRATSEYSDLAERRVSFNDALAAELCDEGIQQFCDKRGIDSTRPIEFGKIDWTSYEEERAKLAAWLRANPEPPVEDEYSRMAADAAADAVGEVETFSE